MCSNLRSLNVVFTKVCRNLPNLTAFNPNMFGTCSGPVRDMFGFDVFFSFLCFFWRFDAPEGVRKVFGTCSGPVRVSVFPLFEVFFASPCCFGLVW